MNYINGRFTEGKGEKLKVYDKYTKETIGELAQADSGQIDEAIAAASEAFEAAEELSAGDRREMLLRIREGVKANRDKLAKTICSEAGKPIDYARTEVERALETLQLAANEAIRHSGEMLNLDYGKATGRTAYTVPMPVGPVLGITPFNFPLNLMMHKVAPALAMGCTIIIKPASSTPLTAVEFAKIVDGADVPKGMFNLVIAPGKMMDQLVESEEIAKITFTGSDKVGWGIKAKSGRKHVTLELGGNAPVIVDSGSDLEKVASEIAYGTMLYAGQICISTQRIIAVEGVYEELRDKLAEKIKSTEYGDPHKEGVVCGSMISKGDVERVREWINEAEKGGAKVITGGDGDKSHNLLQPTLIESAPDDSKIIRDEIFGPVGVMQRAKDFADAVRLANDTRFGLQCGVYTDSLENMKLAQRKLRYGGVIFNSVPGFRMDAMPYGGVGDSGHGREGVRYAMGSMTEKKLVVC